MRPDRKTPTKYEGISRLEWPTGRVNYEARAPWWRDSSGKRHDPVKRFDLLGDARTWRNDRLSERARGQKRATGRLTVGNYLEDWLERFKARAPGNTAARYRFALQKHLKPLSIWRARLADLDRDDVAAAYDRLEGAKVLHVHQALHRALRDAVPKHLGHNPASGAMRGRKSARAERSVWTEDEYRAWLEKAAVDELAVLWRLLGQTGARRGELLGLDWPDVDLEEARITIRRQYTPLDGILTLKDVKTPRGRRTINLDPETITILLEWRKRQPRALRPTERDRHAVFTYADGARIGPTKSLNKRFHDVASAAGVRGLTIHDVRHTHATLLLGRGVPIQVVSRRLGHASEAITLTLYAHVLPDMARTAADVAGAIANSARASEQDHAVSSAVSNSESRKPWPPGPGLSQ